MCHEQKQDEWFEELEVADPRAAHSLLRKYDKHFAENGKKDKLQVLEHKKRIIRRRGTKNSGRKKWMWKDEYVEEMQKTRHGKYTEAEANSMWKEYKDSDKYKTDRRGPRGTTRMRVPIGDFESSFSELDSEEEYEARETPKKKPNAGDLREAGQMLASTRGRGSFLAESGSSDDADREAGAAGGLRRALDRASEGVDVRGFAADSAVTPAKKRKVEKDSEDEANDDSSDSDHDDARRAAKKKAHPEGDDKKQQKPKSKPPDDETWFDADTAFPKAARTMHQQIHKLKVELEMQEQACAAALLEFDGKADKDTFQTEVAVLSNRVEAVRLALGDPKVTKVERKQKLKDYINKYGVGTSSAGSSPVVGKTSGGSSMLAGPCPGFRLLVTIVELQEVADSIKNQNTDAVRMIVSEKGLAEYIDSHEKNFKSLRELAKSAKGAHDELYQARLDDTSIKSQTEKAQKKAAQQREKIMAAPEASNTRTQLASIGVADPAAEGKLFTFRSKNNAHRICLVKMADLTGGRIDLSNPFLLPEEEVKKDEGSMGVFFGAGGMSAALSREATDAARMFTNSNERKHPLKGRGKIDFENAELRNTMSEKLQSLVENAGCVRLNTDSKDQGENRVKKLMVADWHAMIGRKAQIGFESASLAGMRLNLAGSRQFFAWPFSQIGEHVRAKIGGRALRHPINSQATQQWLRASSAEDIASMLDSNPTMGFVAGTAGPNDLIYLPPGWVRAELPSQEDNLMIRISVLPRPCPSSLHEMAIAIADYRVMGKRNIALEFAHDKLKTLLQEGLSDPCQVLKGLIDGRHRSNPLQEAPSAAVAEADDLGAEKKPEQAAEDEKAGHRIADEAMDAEAANARAAAKDLPEEAPADASAKKEGAADDEEVAKRIAAEEAAAAAEAGADNAEVAALARKEEAGKDDGGGGCKEARGEGSGGGSGSCEGEGSGGGCGCGDSGRGTEGGCKG